MADASRWNDTLEEKTVTYHIEFDGRLFLIENVPARANVETGEKQFSWVTVEQLQPVAWERCRPDRTIETRVYEYACLA